MCSIFAIQICPYRQKNLKSGIFYYKEGYLGQQYFAQNNRNNLISDAHISGTECITQRFYELMRDSKMEHYRAGRPFATEGQTECDGGLRVLLSGKMAAKCDDTFLVTIFD